MEDNFREAIEQMKRGDENGFNEVYSQTYNRVYFRAKQIMKKEEDAQDLTQIVFVEAYKSIHTLQSSEAIFSWLDGITYRQGMKIFRKNKDVLLSEEAEGIFEALESNDIATMPELTADQKATSEIIRGIMEELPELQKTAVVAYYFDGLKVEQIADLMECSVNTIKSRLNYARKFIKDRVEEKERKEGYRLHVFGLPVFWYAIKTMADKTTLTAQAAQSVYNGACTDVGLQATAISVTGAAGAVNAAEAVTTAEAAAGGTTKAAAIGAKFASLSTGIKALIIGGAVVLGGAGVAGTIYAVNNQKEEATETFEEQSTYDAIPVPADISKFMSLCRVADENAVPILYPTKLGDNEYIYYAEDLQANFEQGEYITYYGFAPNTVTYVSFKNGNAEYTDDIMSGISGAVDFHVDTSTDIIVMVSMTEEDAEYDETLMEIPYFEKKAEEVTVEETLEETKPSFELTEEAGRQISAFVAAAYQCNYSEVNRGNGWNIFSMSPDDCLMFVNDYIGMVQYIWGVETAAPNAADLPYHWYEGSISTQEMADFFRDGLGIEIPADYSYAHEGEWGSVKIANGIMESNLDGRTLQIVGGTVEVVSQDENGIVLSGNCYWYDPEKVEYQFTVTGVPSENRDVFGGMTITDIEVAEAGVEAENTDNEEVDYQLMAKKCATIIDEVVKTYGDPFVVYYVNDIDKDTIPEFIVLEGTCAADYEYAVYQFDGTDMIQAGKVPYGTLYGSPDTGILYIRFLKMDHEIDWQFDMKSVTELFSGENIMQEDGYVNKYEFPMGTYLLTEYMETEETSIYGNIQNAVR